MNWDKLIELAFTGFILFMIYEAIKGKMGGRFKSMGKIFKK